MWFRNLQLYRLSQPFKYSAEELHDKLEDKAFRPCGSLELSTIGWSSPLGRDGELLTHAANGCIMLCARQEARLLPASVVREVLADKVAEIEANEGRRVHRKEQALLRDEITMDLLPRAFTRSNRMFAYIDPKNGWLIVDSATSGKAEELLTLLRESLGTLQVKPFQFQQAPASVLTEWLTAGAPDGFVIQQEAELREPLEDGGIVRCRRQDLDAAEVAAHLAAGKQVVSLAVEWNERIGCVFSEDMSIKRLKFLDVIQDEAADTEADDAAARFDVDFALMNLELARFIPRYIDVFGGMAED